MQTRFVVATALAAVLATSPAAAQERSIDLAPHGQVLSVQPLSAMLTIYAAEFERALSPSMTLGIGGTYWGPSLDDGDFSYLSGDAKLRYYPGGRPLQGFSIGASVGATRVAATDENTDDSGSTTGATIGTMLEYGWLLGARRDFYVGLGAGAKALFIGEENFTRDVTLRYPTVRLSVGWAF